MVGRSCQARRAKIMFPQGKPQAFSCRNHTGFPEWGSLWAGFFPWAPGVVATPFVGFPPRPAEFSSAFPVISVRALVAPIGPETRGISPVSLLGRGLTPRVGKGRFPWGKGRSPSTGGDMQATGWNDQTKLIVCSIGKH